MNILLTLDDIYNKKIFRIPDYQRGYAWVKPQYVDFWEDLVSLHPSRSHYTGVISIKSVPESKLKTWKDEKWLIESRGYKGYYIVDGQQRLTTISIFIQCLIEEIKNLPENKNLSDDEIYLGTFNLKEIIEKFMVVSQPPNKIIKTYLFGYEADNPSFAFLRYKVYNEPNPSTILETYYTLNLENAKTFFKENISNITNEKGKDILRQLFEKLTQKLMFNLYEIGEEFDVFVAFETMNNRGKKLSYLELLKNRLIYLTSLYADDEVKESDREAVRNNINEAWKEIYLQLGKNKKYPLNDDDFLKAHWILFFKYSRKGGDDYINFLLGDYFHPKKVLEKVPLSTDKLIEIQENREQSEVSDDDGDDNITEEPTPSLTAKLSIKDINTYVASIKSAAQHWYNTHNPQNNSAYTDSESILVDRLNRLGMGYFRPLVMSFFYNTDVQSAERIEVLKGIERFIFIVFRLCRTQTSYRNSIYYNAAREIGSKRLKPLMILDMLDNDMKWTKEEDGSFRISLFRDMMFRKFSAGSGFYGWNGLKYFLYEYEDHLMKRRGIKKVSWDNFIKNEKDKVSIEHIYPQTPTDNCWETSFEGLSDERKKLLTNSLGNLLLLSASINSSLQNICFSDKVRTLSDDNGNVIRHGYSNGSYSEQKVASLPSWNATQIENRTIDLIDFMESRWNISIGDRDRKLDMVLLKQKEDKSVPA